MTPFRFECAPGCTNCCRRRGFVYLTEDDARRAAAHLKMAAGDFERTYLYRTRHLLRLRIPRGRSCVFLGKAGCAIHPAKPTQCALYPFWPELVEDRKAWASEAAVCPGIGTGQVVQIGTAVGTAMGMRRAYPAMYDKF